MWFCEGSANTVRYFTGTDSRDPQDFFVKLKDLGSLGNCLQFVLSVQSQSGSVKGLLNFTDI